MKFSCLQENLSKALGIVTRTIPVKTPLPILANVLLTTEKGRLKLAATDLATTVITKTGASVDTEGSITVPAKLLKEFVANVSPSTLQMNVLNDVLHIVSDKTKSKLNGIPAKDYPELPELKITDNHIEVSPKDLAAAISVVAFAAGADESRPIFTGVYLSYSEDKLTLASTDGYRLSEKTIKVQGSGDAFSAIVPSKTLTEIARIFSGSEETIQIGLNSSENQMLFSNGDTTIATRLLEGQYPDYKRIIPTESILKAVFDAPELLDAVKLTNVIAKENNTPLKLIFDPENGIKVAALSGDSGEHESLISAEIEGDLMEVAFSSKYLLDFLNNVKTPKVTLTSTGNTAATKLIPEEHEDFLHIIMPVQI